MLAFGKKGLGKNAKDLIPTVKAFGGSKIAQVKKGDSYSFLARKGECHVPLANAATIPVLSRQTLICVALS